MDALYLASDKTVRAILTALCDDSEVKDKALAYLDRLEPEAKVKARAPGMGESINKKRKAESEIKICVQCGDTFLEDDNSPRDCMYHSGDMEIDDDSSAWYDWDERCHGTMDSEENRKLYPDGFVWTCCDEEGSATGCKYGRHQSNPEKSKKGSWESESEEESEQLTEDSDEEGEEEEDGDKAEVDSKVKKVAVIDLTG